MLLPDIRLDTGYKKGQISGAILNFYFGPNHFLECAERKSFDGVTTIMHARKTNILKSEY